MPDRFGRARPSDWLPPGLPVPGRGRGFLSLSALASLRGAMPIAASPNSRSGRSSDSTSPIIAPSAVSASLNRPALACSSRIRPGIVLRRYLFCVLSSLCRPLFLCFGGHYSCGSTVAVAPCTGNGKQKRDPRGHVKRDPPVSVNSSVHDLLPWRLFRGCSDLADGLTLAVHIVTCALRSHSRARRVRLSADAPGGVRNRPP